MATSTEEELIAASDRALASIRKVLDLIAAQQVPIVRALAFCDFMKQIKEPPAPSTTLN